MTDRILLEITRIEAAHLVDLTEQFASLLADSQAATHDPAVRRLVPDAYDDPEQAAEFRALVEGDLLERRRTDADVVLTSLRPAAVVEDDPTDPALVETVPLPLDAEQARAWLRTLAALRLVLAQRLGIADEDDHDPEDARFSIYDWLGYRLDGLVGALDRG